MALAALGSFTLAAGQGPKRADGDHTPITNSIGMKLALVPSGEFQMGSNESAEATAAFFNRIYGKRILQAFMFNDEHPQHRVRISRPFYLGVCVVTRGQFRQFVADTNYRTTAETGKLGAVGWNSQENRFEFGKEYSWRNAGFEQTDTHPVVNVSWDDATEFCKWLGKKERRTYQLPTEAQWEYGCRAGSTTRYFFGDDEKQLEEYAWYGKNSGLKTHPVGEKKPNTWGLYDIEGNVGQWCQDWYDGNYYARSPSDDPKGPATGSDRVLRGSSYYGFNWDCYSARRSHWQNFPGSTIGFRVCLVPVDK